MKKHTVFSICLGGILILLNACANTSENTTISNENMVIDSSNTDFKAVVNPNGTSELAQLMEDMFVLSLSWKERVQKGEDLGKYPVAFDKLKTATPTNDNQKDPVSFDPFADDFIRRTQEMLNAPKEEQLHKYTLYVEGCSNCHSSMCSGVLKRIKLLKIEG